MNQTIYQVKAGEFEGPLEVLLNLIEKRKLFINEISLTLITEDYISYVKTLDKHDLENYASFISVAATLILIKSRSLIPNLNLTEEEKEDISSLERRLELYKVIKDIGVEILEKFGKQIIFPRLPNNIEIKVFAPDKQINVDLMHISIKSVLNAMPVEEEKKPEVVILKVKSLDETIKDLMNRIESSMKISFKSFSNSLGYKEGREQKVGVIVSFLAMLELVRSGLIDATQNSDFEDIEINKI